VKFGRGAFMKERAKARELAQAMVCVATRMGKPTRALLTAMDQPLGRTVGNAVEVHETIDCLKGRGQSDVMELTYALGVQMLLLGGVTKDAADARAKLERSVSSGAALRKFEEIIVAQGGDARVLEDPSRLPQSRLRLPVPARETGFVRDVEAMQVALAALQLGAGRARAEDGVDAAVGITGLVKSGERVEKGQPLAWVLANHEDKGARAVDMVSRAIELGGESPAPFDLVAEVIG